MGRKQRIDKSRISFINATEATNLPVLPRASRGSRWHSSHFLDNSHNAVGGYSNKGGTALGHKTTESGERPRFVRLLHDSRVREDRDK